MSIQENIHNFYEKLVGEALAEQLKDEPIDIDDMSDIACVALNRLPPRYFRHEIDMAFYLSPTEYKEMTDKVHLAVKEAIDYVAQSQREESD